MKIARFNTLPAAQTKLQTYNDFAENATSTEVFSLAEIRKHTTDNIWWFNFDDCVSNGGLGTADIAADEVNLDIVTLTRAQLFSQGYFPAPPTIYP